MDSIQYSSSDDEVSPGHDMKDSKDRSSSGRADGRNSSSSRRYTPEKRRSPDRRSPDNRRYSPVDRSYSRDRRHSPPDSRRSPYSSRHRSSDSSRRSRDDRHHKRYRSDRGSSHRKERDKDRRTRSRSRTPPRRSHHRDHGSPPPRRRSKEKSPAPSHPPPPPPQQVKKPFDPQKKMLLLDKMGIDYKGTEEEQQSSGPSNPTIAAAIAAATAATIATTTSSIPGLMNPLVINTSRYEEQINKRKLLWNSKKAAPGNPNNNSNTSIWQGAKFSQDQDGKVAAKFQRLMGMKEPVTGAPAGADSKGRDLIKKQEELFSTMEMQYEVARATTHTQRGVGLGFGPRHIP